MVVAIVVHDTRKEESFACALRVRLSSRPVFASLVVVFRRSRGRGLFGQTTRRAMTTTSCERHVECATQTKKARLYGSVLGESRVMLTVTGPVL